MKTHSNSYTAPKPAQRPDPYQIIMQKTFEKKIPFIAHWELTYRCNLSCRHCYANTRTHDELTLLEIEDILEQLAHMNCLFLTFTGGEVFCRNDIASILKSAQKRNFAIRLFTNGTLITPEHADSLAEAGLLSVEISLYSMEADIHDMITNTPGSHNKTITAIKLCRERNINTTIKSPLLKYNVSEYRKLKQFAENIGAKFVFDFVLVPTDSGSTPMKQHGLSEKQIFEFILANAVPGQNPPGTHIDTASPVCGAGSNTICINPQGDVFPCLAVRKSAGNLRNDRLAQIWKSPALDKLRVSRYCDLLDCCSCDMQSYCPRCPGAALAECGNLLGKYESACSVARATKKAIKKLMAKDTNASHKEKKDIQET